MNDNAKAWVEALRSKKYRQTTQVLREGDGFCCLGVLCDVYREKTENGEWREEDGDFTFFVNGYQSFKLLPKEVQTWAGLTSYSGANWGGSLSLENDKGKTFEEIADLIEAEPLGMFEIES